MNRRRKSLYILPSLFTVSSIFCGFLAIVMTLNATGAEEIHRAALLIGLAMILDAFDGRVARMTNTQSAFGVQLDSLADLISFGVAPAVIVYQFSLQSLGMVGVFAAFCFVACGALRLARFNVQAAEETGPSSHFVGLPIPAAAGVAASFVLMTTSLGHFRTPEMMALPAAGMLFVLGLLMVSNVPYKTFKKIRVTPHEQVLVAFVVAVFAFATVTWGASMALAVCLAVYVTAGLMGAVLGAGRKRLSASRANFNLGLDDLDD